MCNWSVHHHCPCLLCLLSLEFQVSQCHSCSSLAPSCPGPRVWLNFQHHSAHDLWPCCLSPAQPVTWGCVSNSCHSSGGCKAGVRGQLRSVREPRELESQPRWIPKEGESQKKKTNKQVSRGHGKQTREAVKPWVLGSDSLILHLGLFPNQLCNIGYFL